MEHHQTAFDAFVLLAPRLLPGRGITALQRRPAANTQIADRGMEFSSNFPEPLRGFRMTLPLFREDQDLWRLVKICMAKALQFFFRDSEQFVNVSFFGRGPVL